MQYDIAQWLLAHRETLNLTVKMQQNSYAYKLADAFPEAYEDGVLTILRKEIAYALELSPEDLQTFLTASLVKQLTPELFVA